MLSNKISEKLIVVAFSAIYLMFLTPVFYAAPGDIDPTFNGSAYGATNGNVFVIKQQADGKILVGGQFTEINGFAAAGIARLNADRSVDKTFNPPDFYNGSGIGATIYAIALQPDGKILVGGYILGAGDDKPGIRRLNPDGSLDSQFFIQELNRAMGTVSVYDIKLRSDGKIMVGGFFGFISPEQRTHLIRLNSDGTLDVSFIQPDVRIVNELEILPDGKIVVGGNFAPGSSTPVAYIDKFNEDGSNDPTFTETNTGNGAVETLKVLPDGSFVVGGNYSTLKGFSQGGISKINSDGSLDLNFNINNTGANGSVKDIALRTGGKFIVGGTFTTFNSSPALKIAGLNQDGTLDSTFQNNPEFTNTTVFDVDVLPDGKVLAGTIDTFPAVDPLKLLNSNGETDLSFVGKLTRIGFVRKIVPQPDGKILIGGEFPYVNGVARNSIARLNVDGTVDSTFVPYFTSVFMIYAVALQADGKVLVGGAGNLLRRLNIDGSQDLGFNPVALGGQSTIYDILVLPNGQILAAGVLSINFGTKYIARFNADGSLDSAFAADQPNGLVRKLYRSPDGKILIGGAFTQIGSAGRGRIARLDGVSGAVDTSFNPPGGANATVYDLDLQPDGKVLVVGDFTSLTGNSNIQKIGRLNADGTLDTSFVQATNGTIYAVKLQPDGKMLIGGSLSAVSSVPRNGIARLNANGTIDAGFATHANTSVWDIDLQTDGKILLGGEFHKINQRSAVRIARLINTLTPIRARFDFDGDGKSDVSVFRPSTNRWYELLSSNSQVFESTFGSNADVVAAADYDGDGKTDIAIFRPSSGAWWYLSSVDGTQKSIQFGASGDIPRPSDIDGDGKDDFVVFRPSNNVWYRLSSGNGAVSVGAFGAAGDKPLVGDFDGDGKSDLAIYRPSTGTWWYRSSINNAQIATAFGISTDVAVPADYDGDGKTDLAVYRPSTGVWYILNSSTGQATIIGFGLSEDKPVAADYDGDGKADIAVFRPSTGVWYLLRSTAGFTALQFGVSTDMPIPNSFVH